MADVDADTGPVDADRAPRHLSTDSRKLWREIHADMDLEPWEVSTLRLGLEALDRASTARRMILREGAVIDGRFPGTRVAHPAVAIEREARAGFLACLKALNLPAEDDDVPQSRSTRGRYGARRCPGRVARTKAAPPETSETAT